MSNKSFQFSFLVLVLVLFLGFAFVAPKTVRADALGDFISRMTLGDFIRGLFGLPPSGGASPAPLPPEPAGGEPAPNSPGSGPVCFYNVKLINANGEAQPSALQTGTLESGGCRTPGVRELVPSYYTQGSTATNRPEWPCTDANYVGQNCTQGIVTGQFICMGGPAHEIKGCYNRTSGAYQRVSVTPLNPTNTPMPDPSNTPRPGATNTPTPVLNPFFPSYCGCQATFRYNRSTSSCNGPDECGSPDIRNGRVVSMRTDENGNCTQTDYYCSTNGIPPTGNCNCVVDKSEDYTLFLPSEQSCLGRNRVGERCYLPADYQLDHTGTKNTWVDGKCLKLFYRCPAPLPTNTPMPDPSNTPKPGATNTPVPNPTNTPVPEFGSFAEWERAFYGYLAGSSNVPITLTDLEAWRINTPPAPLPTPTELP